MLVFFPHSAHFKKDDFKGALELFKKKRYNSSRVKIF
jgi:hypothetical protein